MLLDGYWAIVMKSLCILEQDKKVTELRPCKLGTMPALIQLRFGYRIREGLLIQFRHGGEGYEKWHVGRVWKVNPDGYFFVEWI